MQKDNTRPIRPDEPRKEGQQTDTISDHGNKGKGKDSK